MKIAKSRIFTDLVLISILTIAAVLMDKYWEPPRPMIRCHDPAISLPKRDNTVSTRDLIGFGVFVPILIFLLCDIAVFKAQWARIYQNLTSFIIGTDLVYVTNNLIKYNLGWPRPYYLEACNPDYSIMDCTRGYVSDPPCRGDPLEIRSASLTFPSLHSSIAAFTVTYLFIFLCQRNNELPRSYRSDVVHTCSLIVQCLAFTWYVFVAASRVSDFRHHVHDVIAGSVWGLAFALLLIYRHSDLIKTQDADLRGSTHEAQTSYNGTRSIPNSPEKED